MGERLVWKREDEYYQQMVNDYETLNGNSAARELVQIAQSLLASGGISTLGVCGLGGAGKSTVSKIVARELSPRIVPFTVDWFLVDDTSVRRGLIESAISSSNLDEIHKWENPSLWYDWQATADALRELLTKRQLKIPKAWNQETGCKDQDIFVELPESDPAVVLVDGIYLLHPEISPSLDMTVLLKGSARRSFLQSSLRDAHRSPADYLEFKERLLREFDIPYFERYRKQVDRVIQV